MAIVPLIQTVAQRIERMGPTIPSPERVINNEGFVVYNIGDPVPVGEARARGWMATLPEPEPLNASNRGRKIRSGDRQSQRTDDDTMDA